MQSTIIIHGTHCQSCKALLEEVVGEYSGVRRVTVDFSTGRTVIEHEQELIWEELQEIIGSVGDYHLAFPLDRRA